MADDDAVPVPVANLREVPLGDLPKLEGDEALEATLRRLQREVKKPREAVSGFSSAI
jgi:FXSXX-COOH protein